MGEEDEFFVCREEDFDETWLEEKWLRDDLTEEEREDYFRLHDRYIKTT